MRRFSSLVLVLIVVAISACNKEKSCPSFQKGELHGEWTFLDGQLGEGIVCSPDVLNPRNLDVVYKNGDTTSLEKMIDALVSQYPEPLEVFEGWHGKEGYRAIKYRKTGTKDALVVSVVPTVDSAERHVSFDWREAAFRD